MATTKSKQDLKMLRVIEKLAKVGISVELDIYKMSPEQTSDVVLTFKNGFYKSDGMAKLILTAKGFELHSRYESVKIVKTISDIVRESYEWFEYSADRFIGWSSPALGWGSLYKKFDLLK